MMKRSFQWLRALALMVMGALAFVACSSNDGDGGVPDNSKILGTWVVKEVSPNDGNGPKVGMEMTFNANGTFTSGEHDNGTYTYNSETGAFTATMGDMTMSGNFTVDGDNATGRVNVTVGGQTRTYTMKMGKKGSEPAVSSTKMVGTWKVMKDGSEAVVGKTFVFNEDGTCTLGGTAYTYTCEEQEDGSLSFEVFNGENSYIHGALVLVNNGNVLNGVYQFAFQTKGAIEITDGAYGIVLKKPQYNYPTEGVQGRWQFTYVAQVYGGYDDYFAKRLPVLYYNDGGITYTVNEVFVIGDNGELYVEGDPYVGSYSFNNNQLDLQFAGKYVAKVHGLIQFSGDDTMTIPQGRGTFKESATSGGTTGFQGTIQRVIEENSGGEEEVEIDERMLGDWTIMTDEGDANAEGKTMTFNADGTWEIANYQSGTYTTETLDDGRIQFNIYNEEDVQVASGKLIVVSGGNVLTGEYGTTQGGGGKAKTRMSDNDKFRIVLKKPSYTYPSANNSIKGRWKMTECSIDDAPVGGILVFGESGEMYMEGDPHINSYSITYTVKNGVITCDPIEMEFSNGPTITGTVPLSGTTVTLTGTAQLPGGGSMSMTAKLVRQTGDDNGDDNGDETTVSSEKMVGTWDVAASAFSGIMVGKQMVFNKNGTFTYNNITYQYTCEERSDGRLRFELYNYGDNEYFADGKFVLVSEGNVLSGEYQMDGVQEGEDEDGYLSLVLRKPGYTYPTGGVMGRWKMTQCSIDAPMLGKILVFGKDGELYIEGDPHIDSYTYNSTTKKIKMVFPDGDASVVVEGTVTISNNTMSLSNATVKMKGQTISMTATLVKQ